MTGRTHEDFLDLIRERIAKKQYDELFSGGCCFHFALRSFQRGIGSLAYTQAALDQTKKGHTFVITPGGQAFDHKGYRDLGTLIKEFRGWSDEPHFTATEAEIAQDVVARRFPPDLEKEVYAIADEIITRLTRCPAPSPSPN